MPCSDGGYGEDYNAQERQRAESRLCFVMTRMEEGWPEGLAQVLEADPGLKYWWVKHKEEDRQRAAKEAADALALKLRAIALSKLTLAERAVLGLNRG